MPIRITMTGRNPVEINEFDWPIVAEASHALGPCRPLGRVEIVVRRHHADGRTIVYARMVEGVHEDTRHGFLLPAATPGTGDGVHRSIRRVAGMLRDHELGTEVLARLPPEVL